MSHQRNWRRTIALLGLSLAAIWPATSSADDDLICPSAEIWGSFLFTGICWDCVLPIRVFAGQIGDSAGAPAGAADSTVCLCEDELGVPEVGLTTGMWHPTKILEITHTPYCSPTLGGVRLSDSFKLLGGRSTQAGAGGGGKAFYNYHMYAFPLFEILEILIAPICTPASYTDFDLLFISELDPTWSDPELTLFAIPEALLFTGPSAALASLIDCPASSVGKPIDDIYWFAGCWGNLYPFSGHISGGSNPVRDTSLAASRAMAQLHRRGLAKRTVGEDTMCESQYFPHIKKSQYKMQMMYPRTEAAGSPFNPTDFENTNTETGDEASTDDRGTEYTELTPGQRNTLENPGSWGETDTCCHRIGESTFRWGEWRNRPAKENHLYLLWQWVDCCLR